MGRRGRRGGSAVHQGLIGDRALIGTRYLADPGLRAEYARDIAPRTEAALARILAELYEGERSGAAAPAGAQPSRAIDLGAGTGAVGQALRRRFGASLEIVGVDLVDGPGLQRANLARELPEVAGRFDLVVAAHLLNELYVDASADERARRRAERVMLWTEALLAPGGLVILIEPALRETSRELLEVRDRLVAAGLTVRAPCLRQERCPALGRERDWCHDAAPVVDRGRVDFSYLVLARTSSGEGASLPQAEGDLYRVVSDPLRDKGRLRIYGCGAAGRQEILRLDRDTSAANAAFARAVRGDVVSLREAQVGPQGLRITPETQVSRR